VIPLGVDGAKQLIMDRLLIEHPGPGCMHFNQACDEEYFLQLTAEKLVTKYVKGFPTQQWVLKDRRRNEMLDCEVLNLAAISLLNANMEKLAEGIERQAAKIQKDPEPPPIVDGEPATKKEVRTAKRKGRESFVQSWRY
jgi:phage terminase large subunit GpA-like protein